MAKKVCGSEVNDFDGEPTYEEYIVRKVGAALKPLGTTRQGFKSCSTKKIIEVMAQSGWNITYINEVSNGIIDLYFNKGNDECVINYDNLHFKIKNFHSI